MAATRSVNGPPKPFAAHTLLPHFLLRDPHVRIPTSQLVRPVFVGHHLPCPACDHSFVPNFPIEGSPDGWNYTDTVHWHGNGFGTRYSYPAPSVRIGLMTPCWLGLDVVRTIEHLSLLSLLTATPPFPTNVLCAQINATFVNYDRQGFMAVGGFSQAVPQNKAGYDKWSAGGMETRFRGVKWLQSDFRVRWRWANEMLLTDTDGTFCERPYWRGGCSVVRNDLLVQDKDSFSDCQMDARYDAAVCEMRSTHVVKVGINMPNPLGEDVMINVVAHRDANGPWVNANDTVYLRNKWRAAGSSGSYNLVDMDLATNRPTATIIGEYDGLFVGGWNSAVGEWLSSHVVRFTFTYVSIFTNELEVAAPVAEISADGAMLTWTNGTRQLFNDVPWHRCELVPHECVGTTMYDDAEGGVRTHRQRQNSESCGGVPSLDFKSFTHLLATNRRYLVAHAKMSCMDAHGNGGPAGKGALFSTTEALSPPPMRVQPASATLRTLARQHTTDQRSCNSSSARDFSPASGLNSRRSPLANTRTPFSQNTPGRSAPCREVSPHGITARRRLPSTTLSESRSSSVSRGSRSARPREYVPCESNARLLYLPWLT